MTGWAVNLAAMTLTACGPTEEPAELTSPEVWECTGERDGWERCDGDSVIWCHGVAGMGYDGAHFHEGTNCAEDGMTCVRLDERVAACLTEQPCRDEATRCEDRYAYNCVEGTLAQTRCSLAEDCQVDEQGARCVPKQGS